MSTITGETTLSLEVTREAETIKTIPALAKHIEELSGGTTADLLRIIFGGAVALNASDLHVEPGEEQVKVRLRVDGILHDVISLAPKSYRTLLSRVKLLAGMKLNISDRPQDGRFSVVMAHGTRDGSDTAAETAAEKIPETRIEIRVSAIPAERGEAMVARILNPKNLIHLDELGLREDLLAVFREEIKKPNGMIIVTGPTGSGKTTTLYAFLKTIQNPEIKIITIEDPIEYHLEGVEQTQISKNYGFANGLKSIVRQDPDVILVGEIRDGETCDIALQAALTGHLVFTTIHTNDAAGTIARLIALDAKPYNIGPAINIAVAQRLVRKLCQGCSEPLPISGAELKIFQQELKDLPKQMKIPEIKSGIKLPRATGCEICNGTGYKGRIGIFECFPLDSEMETFILKLPSIAELRDLAIKKGMVTMRQDGLIKALRGVTNVKEVERVTAEKA